MQRCAPIVSLLACSVLFGTAPSTWAYGSGAATCSYPNAGWSDMGSGQSGTGGFVLRVFDADGPVTHYSPGEVYTVEISNSADYAGFLLQCVKGIPGNPNVNGVGVFAWDESTLYQNGPCTTPAASVTHRTARAVVTGRRKTDTVRWTAPPKDTGTVTFHLVGVGSRFAWYGRGTLITTSLMEGGTPVHGGTWSEIKALYR